MSRASTTSSLGLTVHWMPQPGRTRSGDGKQLILELADAVNNGHAGGSAS